MKKKEFLTEAKRKAIISDKEKAILESFAKTFNKIKRIDENELDMGEIGRLNRSVESGINPYQLQPELSDLGQLTPKQEQMKEYISNYVNSELELNHEMVNYIENGYQGLSDTVKQGLKNDMDYQSWVQMSHDEETFRREKGGIDENKYGGDSPYFEALPQALDFVREYATKLGYEVDEEDMFFQFGTGGVGYEQTKSANIGLLKNGKELNRFIHVSIYRMPSGKYELTMYKTF